MDSIPVIDIGAARGGGPARAEAAHRLGQVCEAIGFFCLAGHGIDEATVVAAQDAARAFFEQDQAAKAEILRRPPVFNRGWIPPDSESLGSTLGEAQPNDLKESFTMGPPDIPETEYYTRPEAFPHFARNVWPTRPARLQPALSTYFRQVEALATELMRLFALALQLPEHWFDDKIDRQCGSIRALYYPPQPEGAAAGQLRAGAHTDYGCLTILKTEAASGGLQVMAPHGDWLDVPSLPGTFVVNLGDLMRHWTNDRWSSTLHRVINPPPEQRRARGRLSLAFFHQPNYDAVIDSVPSCVGPGNPPHYEATTSGSHRLRKLYKANAFDAQSPPAAA